MPTTPSNPPTGRQARKAQADPTDIEQSDLGPIQASGTILTPEDIERIRATNPSVEIKVAWTPNPKQTFVLQSHKAKEIFTGWAKRSGKTELSRAWMVKGNTHKRDHDMHGRPILHNMSYIYHPNFLGVVIRKNEKDLADWVERAKPFYATLGGRFIRNPAEFKFNSGARIFLGHAEDKNAWTKYAGQSIIRMFVDEAGQIPDLSLYDQLLSCVRSDFPEMIAQLLLAANPGGPGQDWLVNRFCEPKDRNGELLINPLTKKPYTEEETSRGDLIYEKVEIPAELRSPGDPEFEWSIRQWIEMKMTDNPFAMKDKSYIISLASMSDPKMRNAYLLGHYKALRGTYFDIFAKSTHTVPKDYPVSSWWQTAGSLDWGFVHEAAAYKSKRDPRTKQLIVYGEQCVSRTDPVELGASLAHWWMPELAHHPSIRLYVSHDLFHNKIGEFTWADLIEKGVKKVLGQDSCWVPDLVAQKLKASLNAQGRVWTEELENSLRYRKTKGLVLLRAPSSRSVGFMHVRSLMRIEPLPGTEIEGFSWEVARRLWIEDGEEAYQKYVDLYRNVQKEFLPQLLISQHCPRLIEALPKAIHHPDKPEDVDDTHFYGMDSIDSLRYLCTGVRDDQGKGEPDEVYRRRKIDEALARNPNLTTPDLIWINREIEAELEERSAGQDGFNLPRRSRQSRYSESNIVQ